MLRCACTSLVSKCPLRASPAGVSHAWRVLQPRRQRELPRRTCSRPAPCSAGWPSTGRPLTPGRAACAACGPGATRITHGPTAGTRTCAPRRPRAIRIRHGPTAAHAAWRAGAAGVLDGAAAGSCTTAICMPQGHGTAMECARRTMGGHGLPGQALESGHA
jgi:hypothetical protein